MNKAVVTGELSEADLAAIAELRRRLAAERRAGAPFAEAWERSCAAVSWPGEAAAVRQGWAAVLRGTRGAWRCGYEHKEHAGSTATASLEALV